MSADPGTVEPDASAPARLDAIVIGSGFGGAVAAARLAQAGLSVTVLERGRRWLPGDFPRDPSFDDGWLWHKGRGLYQMRWLRSMLSVQVAGWGGGSLAYANVFARPSDSMLPARWPAHLSRERLDPYYDLAAHMLEVRQMIPDPRSGHLPARTRLLEDLVTAQDRPTGTVLPLLAVQLRADPADVDRALPNRYGVAQLGCDFSGECIAGCNRGAKNSVDHNYLAVAEAAGARGITAAEVDRIEPVPGGFRVRWRDPATGATASAEARHVLVAAGAVGSTELLLRARDRDGTLPALSDRLGEGYSGNGDFLGFVRPRTHGRDLFAGPTITSTTIMDIRRPRRRVWFQVQDGGLAPSVGRLLDHQVPFRRLRGALARFIRTPRSFVPLLYMGEDAAAGRLSLDRRGDAVLRWSNRRNGRLYRDEELIGPQLGKMVHALGGSLPLWTLLRRGITVHNLGGVPPGADRASGVVDEHGRVHGYPGLWVIDGSALPAATGVNPSATILAAAERNVEHLIREELGDPGWRAPEWPDVRHVPAPEDAAVEAMAARARRVQGGGVTFEWRAGSRSARRPGIELRVGIRIPGMDAFVADPEHRGAVTGRIVAEGITAGADVDGHARLFPDDGGGSRLDVRFTGDDGRVWRLDARSPRAGRTPLAALHAGSTLRCQLTSDDGERRRAVLVRSFRDLLRTDLSIRGHALDPRRRRSAVLRYLGVALRGTLRP